MRAAANSGHLAPGDERLQRIFLTDPQLAGLRNPDGTVNKDVLAAQGLTALVGWWWMPEQGLTLSGWHWPTALLGVPLAAVGVALVAAAVPAVSAYRVDVTSLLQSR
jgi:hypothetical protein